MKVLSPTKGPRGIDPYDGQLNNIVILNTRVVTHLHIHVGNVQGIHGHRNNTPELCPLITVHFVLMLQFFSLHPK